MTNEYILRKIRINYGCTMLEAEHILEGRGLPFILETVFENKLMLGEKASGSQRYIGGSGTYTFEQGWIIREVIDPTADIPLEAQQMFYDAAVNLLGQIINDRRLTYFEMDSTVWIMEYEITKTRSFDMQFTGFPGTYSLYQIIPEDSKVVIVIVGSVVFAILLGIGSLYFKQRVIGYKVV